MISSIANFLEGAGQEILRANKNSANVLIVCATATISTIAALKFAQYVTPRLFNPEATQEERAASESARQLISVGAAITGVAVSALLPSEYHTPTLKGSVLQGVGLTGFNILASSSRTLIRATLAFVAAGTLAGVVGRERASIMIATPLSVLIAGVVYEHPEALSGPFDIGNEGRFSSIVSRILPTL